MNQPGPVVRLGTRASKLARWQTDYVRAELERLWPGRSFEIRVITTTGDRVLDTPLPLIGGKGLFTAELEAALLDGSIDLAVHSLKDLPTQLRAGLAVGAVPPRADSRDALVSGRGFTVKTLPPEAQVGTSSTRRAAQLLHLRPDLRVLDLRGNADTRLRKALEPDGPYAAILIAKAALERLDRLDTAGEILPFDTMLPAPGQGAMAVQCRDDAASLDLLRPLNDSVAELEVGAERAFLEGLGGGCAVPVASYGKLDERGVLHLRGRISAPDGSRQVDVSSDRSVWPESQPCPSGLPLAAARRAGANLAATALQQGARELLGGYG
jgi:hydroxymethylbilane synthase